MMHRTISLAAAFLLALAGLPAHAQRPTATVSGYITDLHSGETLLGAGVLVEGSGSRVQTGAVTNVYGYYTLTLPVGPTRLQYSYVGYASRVLDIDLRRDTTINVVLVPSAEIEEAVVVSQKDAGIQSTYLGAVDVPLVHIQNTPVLFGEADVLKALQMMPGVQGGNEGFTGLYVRGGGPDENLILLDGVPIYNVDHMLGILSVFQTEAVKKVTLYKGSFPARYGGRVSSIVDIRTNDGNMKETHGSIGIGVLTDKVHLEGPILKDRLSYSVSARGLHTILYDPLIRFYGRRIEDGQTAYGNYYFYDLNGKLSWRPGERDRLFLTTYNGRDRLAADMSERYDDDFMGFARVEMGIGWGNNVASLRWNHIFNSRLFANTTVAFNRYRMLMHTGARETEADRAYHFDIDYNSGIRDWSGKVDFDYVPDPRHLVKFGAEYIHHTFIPETLTGITDETDGEDRDHQEFCYGNARHYKGHDLSFYGEDDISLGEHLTVNPGLHLSLFNTERKTYASVQPRLSARYGLDNGLSFKAGYARMAQYVHLLSSAQISLPIDLWVPITKDIRPVTSDQFSAGVYYDALKGWEFSIEGYYKAMSNILEYKDGTIMIGSSTGWEDKVEMGKGRAMGLEFFIQKTAGPATGWIAYTLAKSDRQFPDGSINLGERFPYKYDRRHNLNLNLNYALSKRVELSAAWMFATGGTTTVPVRSTVVLGPDGVMYETDFVQYRNNYRLPSSHHLNLGFNFHKQKRHGEAVWNVSVYNVYNQMNPNLIFVNYERYRPRADVDVEKTRLVVEKVTLLPVLPSVSYTYKF